MRGTNVLGMHIKKTKNAGSTKQRSKVFELFTRVGNKNRENKCARNKHARKKSAGTIKQGTNVQGTNMQKAKEQGTNKKLVKTGAYASTKGIFLPRAIIFIYI